MRTHVRLSVDPDTAAGYLRRTGARVIGGTLPLRTVGEIKTALARRFEDDDLMHLTLSLPAGRTATDDLLTRLIATDLAARGVDPLILPWTVVRHTDARCEHVHALVVCRTWTGRPLVPATSRRLSDRIERHLCRLVGLPLPRFFDPSAAPALDPPTPVRNLSGEAGRLHDDLRRSIRLDLPGTLPELSAAMARRGSRYILAEGNNLHGVSTFTACAPGHRQSVGALGDAWQPRHFRARLAFAGLVAKLRPLLQVTILARQLARAVSHDRESNPIPENLPPLTIPEGQTANAGQHIPQTDPHHSGNRADPEYSRRSATGDRSAPSDPRSPRSDVEPGGTGHDPAPLPPADRRRGPAGRGRDRALPVGQKTGPTGFEYGRDGQDDRGHARDLHLSHSGLTVGHRLMAVLAKGSHLIGVRKVGDMVMGRFEAGDGTPFEVELSRSERTPDPVAPDDCDPYEMDF